MSLAMPGPFKHTNGTYYLRQRVPADLSEIARGRTISLAVDGKLRQVKLGQVVKVSLDTKDARTAKERFRDVDAALQETWAIFRRVAHDGPQKLTHKQVLALAGLAHDAFTEAFDSEPGPARRWVDVIRSNISAANGGLASLKIGPITKVDEMRGLEERFGPIVDTILRREGVVTDEESRARVVRETWIALDQAALTNLRKATGDYAVDPDERRFPDWERPASPAPVSAVTISGLFEEWHKEGQRRGVAPSTYRRFRPAVDQFIAFLGHDDATRVTRADAIRWRDEVLASGSLSAATFSKVNRAALNVVFAKGVDLLKLAENPFAGLKVAKDKRPVLRDKSFSAAEAKAILAAALRAPEAPGRTETILRTALRWVPWVCAYTGARVGEITQLRKEDVIEDDGIPCIRITPEAGAVKNKEARIVPLHPHLVEQGFLAFVDGAKSGPLFYSAEAKSAQPWQAVSGRIGEWVRKDVGITDRAIRPNHAWRHRFRTVCDDVGIEQKYVNAICGHAPGSEGERYGERSARALLREIERVPWYRL